ncbi:DUF4389 domain-containing protein [Marinomonas algarum]|uniref:DUF4389 domain-containing protein n=1 Tax=Marinomonas algarum TaxID=2883105 RepID=A0A9X1IM69_9GAMM|nr:DUF4389 domain-containing protein [Marinomonas algarum]MCB5161842.1 DUF4389 domain-containing protein [Marinomonas algarum]
MSKPGYADQGFWFRIVFMLLYWLILNLAITVFGFLLIVVSVVKLGSKSNPDLLGGWLKKVSLFIGQVFSFLSYKTEEKPFPFQPWPEVNSDDEG